MKNIAFIFPGQGSQGIGMGKDFFDNSNIAKDMIVKASQRLDIDFKNLLFEENELFIDSRELETALSRLKISFVIKQKKIYYNYTIPLFKESVQELTKDMDKKLKREIKKFKISQGI